MRSSTRSSDRPTIRRLKLPVSIAGKRFKFDLVRSAKAASANCLASASADVRVRSEGARRDRNKPR